MRWIYSVLVIALLLLVIGVDSCPVQSGGSSLFGGQQLKKGLDVSLVSGVGYFTQGMEIEQGDTFKTVLKLDNYDKTIKQGTVCVNDDKEDVYGGIFEECSQFYVKAADYDSQDKLIQAGSTTIYLPSQGDYSYHDIPIAQQSKLFVTLSYIQHSVLQGTVNAPNPPSETAINLVQPYAPISVNIAKTISKQGDQYKVALGLTFNKVESNAQIFTEDMKTENKLRVSLKMSNYNFDCQQGVIDMENTKFIKCSTLLPLEQIGYPLLVNLDYGVKVINPFDFKIKAKEVMT